MATPIQVIPFQSSQFGVDTAGQFGQVGQNLTTNPLTAIGVPQVPTQTTSGTGTSPGNGTPTQSSQGAPAPGIVKNFQIKQKLLRPSLTSHFQCWFNPPGPVRGSQAGQYYLDGGELVSLLCSEASLPGSSIITNEINDDYTGVTERPGYRRQYDDRTDFTFYVDHGRQNGSYNVIMFFEEWIRYAMGETNYAPDANYHYRVNFPDGQTGDFGTGYRTNIFITKFERDFAGNYLNYTFVQAYPISISSMPVSYDSSELLKCTVSFTYNRYIVTRRQNTSQIEPSQPTATGIPPIYDPKNPPVFNENPLFTNPQFQVARQNLVGNIEPYHSANGITTPINKDPWSLGNRQEFL